MTDFQSINRVMGTRQEQIYQAQNGDFDDALGLLMDRVDPYWEEREKTEMDIFERQAPVVVGQNDDGSPVIQTTHTARTPSTDDEGEPEHRQEGTIVSSELLPLGEMDLEAPE